MSQQWLPPNQQGYPYSQRTGYQQPMQTGYAGNSSFLQPQRTGFPGPGGFGQQQGQGPPPVPPIPSNFQSNFQSQPSQQLGQPQFDQASRLAVGQQAQQQRFLSPSPALGAPLTAQPTGYNGPGGMEFNALRPITAQPTGYLDPRLQMMSSTFMPANLSAPYAPSGIPQFAGGPSQNNQSLQQSFQQHNQAQRGTTAPKVPWALSKEERKNYDQIFRAWDTSNSGFISGEMASEVFGQSGLDRNDLAQIWTLADADNRGKLNIQEFHVAMGLIYRRLNGNEIPAVLPPELEPPSSKNLAESVDFLKGLLQNDSHERATNQSDGRGKVYSFRDNSGPKTDPRKDGTIYKHDDNGVRGYTSRSRRVDRDAIRSGDSTPSDDLSDIKRQLANTNKRLDKERADADARTAEDEALDNELDDLKYRVRRVQDDLDHVSRGPRSNAKDQERRKLERELLYLMHEKVPEVEKKIEERDKRKKREKEQWTRDRNRRNNRYDRYDSPTSPLSRERDSSDDEAEPDRGYHRGTFDRERESERSDRHDYSRRSDERDRDRDRTYGRDSRNRDRDYDRRAPSPPTTARSPAPPAPPAASLSVPRSPVPAPSASPAPQTKAMSPAERQAFIRQQAQQRLQERMKALGVSGPPPNTSSPIDTSVEDRLAKERQEAEEKARQAEKDAEEREKVRKQRLEEERAARTPKPPAPPAPTLAPPASKPAPPPPAGKRVPPAPPPPRPSASSSRTPSQIVPAPPPPASRVPVIAPVEDDPEEDEEFRRREELLKKRAARRAELERAEAEARKEEEEFEKRMEALRAAKNQRAIPSPATNGAAAPPPPPPSEPEALTPPAPRTNPFHKLSQQSSGSSVSPASTPAVNPWSGAVEPETTSGAPPPPPPPPAPPASATTSFIPPAPPAPSKSPFPPPTKSPYNPPPLDDWEDPIEKDDDSDSSDDEVISRDARINIANQIFSGIARPQSTGPGSSPSTPAPPPPPPAPKSPAPAFKAPSGPPDVNALMNSIVGGARLRPTKTNDRSTAAIAGVVLGDTAPPAHINAIPRPVSPPSPRGGLEPPSTAAGRSPSQKSDSRQSVDWYAGLASDGLSQSIASSVSHEAPISEEDEDSYVEVKIPDISIQEPSEAIPSSTPANDGLDLMADVDLGTVHKVRSLYAYAGQRDEDLSFGENLIITAHPSKSGSDWWYGTLEKGGEKGFFPGSYVSIVDSVLEARALYTYVGGSADELPFSEGDVLSIVDKSEGDWWKAEKGGVVFIVPAAYLEITGSSDAATSMSPVPSDKTSRSSETHRIDGRHRESTDHRQMIANAEETSDSESSDYVSYDSDSDSDEEDNDEQDALSAEARKVEAQARETERKQVMEAAGLILKHDAPPPVPPPRPTRKRSTHSRRPPPPVPRPLSGESAVFDRALPPLPHSPVDSILKTDDAFDRYESFKQKQPSTSNRFSITSLDTVPGSPTSLQPSLTSSLSRDGETAHRGTGSTFLNFFNRASSQASSSSLDRKLQISGPLISGPVEPSVTRENSPAFGMSWSSLVDRAVLEDIPPTERKRQEAIFELINTEASYVRDLQLIVETFYAPLLPILNEKELSGVFANIEEILLCNTTFLSSLENRQKESRLYIDSISDILEAHVSLFDVYADYCVGQGPAIGLLQSLRSSRPELDSLLNELRNGPSTRNLDLSSFLLIPMQRITRYPLLIRQIYNTTPPDQDRSSIENSIRALEGILDRINESIRDREGREILASISKDLWIGQGRLDLTADTRHMGPRKLLKEGILIKAKSRRRLHAFLCTDILVLTDASGSARSLYRMPIPLNEVRVSEMAGARDDLIFQLDIAYPRGGDSLRLKASSPRDCHDWMKQIREASRRSKAASQKAAQI